MDGKPPQAPIESEAIQGGGTSAGAGGSGQAEAFAAILYVETAYTARLQEARLRGSSRQRIACAQEALRALDDVRRLMMGGSTRSMADHVVALTAKVGQ